MASSRTANPPCYSRPGHDIYSYMMNIIILLLYILGKHNGQQFRLKTQSVTDQWGLQ